VSAGRWTSCTTTLSTGRVFRCLTVVDDFTRQCPLIVVDTSLTGGRVAEALDCLAGSRSPPAYVVCDNGAALTSRAFLGWAQRRGVQVWCIRPGKPVENAYIERWRRDCNGARSHSGLARRTPGESRLPCGPFTPSPGP
jgi:putative transposase